MNPSLTIPQPALLLVLLVLQCQPAAADETPIEVKLDTSEVPHLQDWGNDAKDLIIRWHPRINNLLATKGVTPPRSITLNLHKTDKGVGSTSGTTISVSSHWIEKHPEDLGLVHHELVHVIQDYPSGDPWWVTEGIADYLRWGVYEGKQQDWFPRPKEKQGYKKGYRVTAGFFLWIESDASPGIVKQLNTAMRNGEYSDMIFDRETGKSLDELWNSYVGLEQE